MATQSDRGIPTYPKLRLLEPQLVDYQGQRMIYMHDSLGIARGRRAHTAAARAATFAVRRHARHIGLALGLAAEDGQHAAGACNQADFGAAGRRSPAGKRRVSGRRRPSDAPLPRGKAPSSVACGSRLSGRRRAAEQHLCELLRPNSDCAGRGYDKRRAGRDALPAHRLRARTQDLRRVVAARQAPRSTMWNS